jgi:hypothetical protein
MFCPMCRDEFRPGFTRCATCGVALVAQLDPDPSTAKWSRAPVAPTTMVDYCGFVSLDEARQARERLRAEDIAGEIVIRDEPAEAGRFTEEYWLRVDRDRFAQASQLLGFDEAAVEDPEGGADESTFQCGECGAEVAAEESFCPGCGARFEEA